MDVPILQLLSLKVMDMAIRFQIQDEVDCIPDSTNTLANGKIPIILSPVNTYEDCLFSLY